jgi:hypothetical protein
VNDGDVGDGDDLAESQKDASPGTGTDAVPSLDEPAPCLRPESRQRAGSSDEVMPALCTTSRKITFRMSWRNVVCAARAGHHLPWSISVSRRIAPHPHCTEGAFGG